MLSVFKHIKKHRYVVQNFVIRDIKIKYRGTIFGYLWSLLEPLSMVLIYDFVFRIIMRRGDANYPLILVLGILPYNYVSSIIVGGASALVNSASLIRRVPLPRELFVLSVVGSNLVTFLLSMLAAVPFMIAFEIPIGWHLLLFPIPVVLMTAFATGIALVMACINVVYRDVGYVLRVAIRMVMYLSPVIYELDRVPERFRDLYLLNPLSVYLTMARNWMLSRPIDIPPSDVAISVVLALVFLVGGAYTFAMLEKKAVKFL
ncbi:MAG: ABC transporter permease [Deltaproteobacteria bacterium]|nr:ABC transporter permease [Deltaproteobacteria bacterium]